MIHHFPQFGELRTFLEETIAQRKAYLLTDSNCLKHCWPELIDPLGEIEILEIDPGEGSKDLDIAHGLWHTLLELHADRNAVLISLGGGVVTDLGGFIASTYKRGIAAIHIPTSLLGMVDAAVGGKTGINLGHSKNQVGTFYQAEAVCLCPAFLESLPDDQLKSGYAEMLKHAVIAGKDEWDQLTETVVSPESIGPLVAASAMIKQDIVDQDEREGGLRKHLNLGHTVGHGIEAVLLHTEQAIPHGNGVAWGMVAEAQLGVKLGITTQATMEAIWEEVRQNFPPIKLSPEQRNQCMERMRDDKKNAGTELRLVLPVTFGEIQRDIAANTEAFAPILRDLFA